MYSRLFILSRDNQLLRNFLVLHLCWFQQGEPFQRLLLNPNWRAVWLTGQQLLDTGSQVLLSLKTSDTFYFFFLLDALRITISMMYICKCNTISILSKSWTHSKVVLYLYIIYNFMSRGVLQVQFGYPWNLLQFLT